MIGPYNSEVAAPFPDPEVCGRIPIKWLVFKDVPFSNFDDLSHGKSKVTRSRHANAIPKKAGKLTLQRYFECQHNGQASIHPELNISAENLSNITRVLGSQGWAGPRWKPGWAHDRYLPPNRTARSALPSTVVNPASGSSLHEQSGPHVFRRALQGPPSQGRCDPSVDTHSNVRKPHLGGPEHHGRAGSSLPLPRYPTHNVVAPPHHHHHQDLSLVTTHLPRAPISHTYTAWTTTEQRLSGESTGEGLGPTTQGYEQEEV